VAHADSAATDVLDTVCPDADPVGSSPIRRHLAGQGDCVPDFQPSASPLPYPEGINSNDHFYSRRAAKSGPAHPSFETPIAPKENADLRADTLRNLNQVDVAPQRALPSPAAGRGSPCRAVEAQRGCRHRLDEYRPPQPLITKTAADWSAIRPGQLSRRLGQPVATESLESEGRPDTLVPSPQPSTKPGQVRGRALVYGVLNGDAVLN
jgi:hypothetical protein